AFLQFQPHRRRRVETELRDFGSWVNVIDRTREREGLMEEDGWWPSVEQKWKEGASSGAPVSLCSAAGLAGTFINCDLRYFNLAALGKFDVVLMDPPWRIRGNDLQGSERR